MKTFREFISRAYTSFYEQAPAPTTQPTAPAPQAAKPVEKSTQAKPAPKVTDASAGVDIDPLGRWQGKVVRDPKMLQPEITTRKPAERTGPDPSLPAGLANPNKKKGYEDLAQSLPAGPSGYKRPGTYDPKQFYPIAPGYGRQFPSPNLPQTGPGLSKSNQDTQIAQAKPEMPSYVRDSIKRQYSGQDYKPEDAKNIINWQKKLKDA